MMNSKKCVVELGVKNSNIFCNEMTKNKKGGKYRNFNENKYFYIECICETEPF